MVFSSVPVYLDPPNWSQHVQQQQQQQQQQHQHQHLGSAFGQLAQQQVPQGLSAPRQEANAQEAHAAAAGSAARPGSMVDRARLAKLPQPEQGMKCPRCDSTNTKFCYFNNYSLTQPRHFCKTCRRYWTRGGALRNVPVGGGFRRNKRSKSSGSSAKSAAAPAAGTPSSSSSTLSTGTGGGITGAITPTSLLGTPHLPFLSSLHPLADHHYSAASGLGLGFSGMQPIDSLEYHLGSNSSLGLENWRPLQQAQQFPFMGGLETTPAQQSASGFYSFDSNGAGNGTDGLMSAAQLLPRVPGGGLMSQLAAVKMEDSSQRGLNLSRHYLALHGNEHFLGGGGGGGSSNVNGAHLSNFNTSSSGSIF